MRDRADSTAREAWPHLRPSWLPLGVLAALLVAGLLRTADASSARFVAVPPAPRTIWLSRSGNDSSCVRNHPLRPCASFNRAYQVAQAGDTVLVAGGNYAVSDPAAGATTIYPDTSKTGTVTFACQGNGDVMFDAPNFSFYPGTGQVRVTGGCFRFHLVHFGYGGYAAVTHDITLDGVHMASFECAGCANVTIENSEVGPAVACDGIGTSGSGANGGAITPAMWCDPNKADQAYWAARPNGSADQQMEPYIHDSVGARPQNFALIHDRIHGMQSTDSFNLHTGGLLIWSVNGLLLRGNTWDHNAVYDIMDNQGSDDANVVIENNVFGWPVEQIDTAQACPGCETPNDWREIDLGNGTMTNVLIRYNSFAHGLGIYNSYTGGVLTATNVRAVGNILGINSLCSTSTAVTFDGNVSVGRACGQHALRIKALPYLDNSAVNYRLPPDSPVACFLANVRGGMSPPTAKCRRRPY